MTDNDKPATDKPVEEPKVEEPGDDAAAPADEPAEEPKAEEPKAEEPGDDAAVPADDGAKSVGTDQRGRQLYSVKCATCGKQTEVPFKPSGDRPVYCRDCYMQRQG